MYGIGRQELIWTSACFRNNHIQKGCYWQPFCVNIGIIVFSEIII